MKLSCKVLPLLVEKSGALENEGIGIVAFKSGAELKDGAFIKACRAYILVK